MIRERVPIQKGLQLKVLVTGVTGQLGYDCAKELKERNFEIVGSGSRPLLTVDEDVFKEELESDDNRIPYYSLNIADESAVEKAIISIKPDAIIHCAAWTNVDGAEAPENRDKVYAVNAIGTENIAKAAKAVDAKMVYISTDYVFNGKGDRPWEPDDKCFAPLNVYGQSKLEGEKAVSSILEKFFIVRIAWVFGINGNNFIKTMINVGKKNRVVKVVNDQIGTPTYTHDLARLLVDMIETDKYGYYHATNEGGYISWYDFCCEFYKQYGMNVRVIPVTTEEYGLNVATRPMNSRLDKRKLVKAGFTPLPIWQDAIKRYLKEANL